MTTISARIIANAAEKERTSVDQIVALALSSQISAWQVRDSIEVRAARGRKGGLSEVLAMVPDVPPMPGDEK